MTGRGIDRPFDKAESIEFVKKVDLNTLYGTIVRPLKSILEDSCRRWDDRAALLLLVYHVIEGDLCGNFL